MKNIVLITIIQLLYFGNTLNGQMNQKAITDLSQRESGKIASILSLNIYEEEKIASIYSDYYSSLSNAINSSTKYIEVVDIAEKKKDLEIEKVLGSTNYRSFLLFESIYTNESIEYYKTLYASLEKSDDLEMKIAEYYRLKIFPVISKLRLEFDAELMPSDKREIDSLKDTIYSYLTIQSDTVVNNTNYGHGSIYYQLLNIGEKYDEEYSIVQKQADPFVSVWKGDLKRILSESYTGEQVESFANQDIELVKLGLLGSINKLSFLIMEPYDLIKFYKNLTLIQNIKDSASEIRLKN